MQEKLVLQYALFPFDKVGKRTAVILYGDRELIKDLSDQMVTIEYGRLLAVIDQDSHRQGKQKILSFHTDSHPAIVMAVWPDERRGAERELLKMGINPGQIIFADRFLSKEPKLIRLEGCIWQEYYVQAEMYAKEQFYTFINPHIKELGICLECVLDFGCGHGRMSAILLEQAEHVICCDANPEAVAWCRARFACEAAACRVECIQNLQTEMAGGDIPILSNSVTCIFTWDTLVHFTYKWIDRYCNEFFRVLAPGGYGIIHHSNLGALPECEICGIWIFNEAGRSDVTACDVRFIAEKHGFEVISQTFLHTNPENMDCLTIIRKPLSCYCCEG